ncbi:MAG: hypothetical protein RQ754_02525 [Desulfuromonadales bacterium]|jgi:predicted membrane protein (TIGR00267 family)|nr:hypothetical protein [Desulfuromonadales bacterium]
MEILRELKLLIRITRTHNIARRYFVVNGFDGALTMLGMIMGFYVSEAATTEVIVSACLGAAIALGMSGISSAYVSEAAERRQELRELESAMIRDLGDAAHGRAARLVPLIIALVNGLSPLLIALVIIAPLWLNAIIPTSLALSLQIAIAVAFVIIFMFGMLLGKVSETFWLFSGLRTLSIGAITCLIIFLLSM